MLPNFSHAVVRRGLCDPSGRREQDQDESEGNVSNQL